MIPREGAVELQADHRRSVRLNRSGPLWRLVTQILQAAHIWRECAASRRQERLTQCVAPRLPIGKCGTTISVVIEMGAAVMLRKCARASLVMADSL
jgi:hypothetical protein